MCSSWPLQAISIASLVLVGLSVGNPAQALDLRAKQCLSSQEISCVTQLNDPKLSDWVITDFLKVDGEGHARLDFNTVLQPKNEKLLDILEYGLPIRSANVQRQIAEKLSKFQDYCDLDALTMKMVISNIPSLSNNQVGVADPRRISRLAIVGCFKKIPDECNYCDRDDNGTGLGFSDLMGFLDVCYGRVDDIYLHPDELKEFGPNRGKPALRRSRKR